MGRVKNGGGDGDAGRTACAAAGEQPQPAAAEVVALLLAGMLDAPGRPQGKNGAEQAGVELAIGLRDLRLRDWGQQRHP